MVMFYSFGFALIFEFCFFFSSSSFTRFTDIFVGFAGRAHDARILANSSLFQRGQNGTLFPQVRMKKIIIIMLLETKKCAKNDWINVVCEKLLVAVNDENAQK